MLRTRRVASSSDAPVEPSPPIAPSTPSRSHRARRGRRRTAALALVAAATLAGCQLPTPGDDAFYQPPAPLPPGTSGSIIRARDSVFTLDPFGYSPVAGTRAWQILYKSTDARNQTVAISGMVIVPTAPWTGTGQRPLVSWGVGTRGVGDDCAPSYTLANGADYEGGFINSAIGRGFAVVVTDYQGLGTPGGHTYMVGKAQGRAVLDAARAAIRLPGTGLDANTPVGVMGYSQGGASAGWAAELAATYAPELKLKGVAAGGVPADLQAVAAGLDGGPFVSFALMTALGYDDAYPELDLASYLNASGQQLVQQADDVCLVSVDGFSTLLGTAFHRLSDYTTTSPLANATWQARLNENKLGSTKPTVPVYQYHGLIDEIVPFPQAAALHDSWCAKGANITWDVQPLSEHLLGLVGGADSALNFLSARFAGTPVTGNCP